MSTSLVNAECLDLNAAVEKALRAARAHIGEPRQQRITRGIKPPDAPKEPLLEPEQELRTCHCGKQFVAFQTKRTCSAKCKQKRDNAVRYARTKAKKAEKLAQ